MFSFSQHCGAYRSGFQVLRSVKYRILSVINLYSQEIRGVLLKEIMQKFAEDKKKEKLLGVWISVNNEGSHVLLFREGRNINSAEFVEISQNCMIFHLNLYNIYIEIL